MITIIDYGLGNLGSIANMLKKAGAQARISPEVRDIENARRLILPGVGAFDAGMAHLHERGLVEALQQKVVGEKTPILGVCLGMQLLGTRSAEGTRPGLGWIDAESVRFSFEGATLRVPHMGWNMLDLPRPHPLFSGLEHENRFYFVHSYHVVCASESDVLARTDYGFAFTSAVGRANILGVQFHPEKSHRFGLRLLRNFADWSPA